MRVLAVIPARYASSRLPGKPLVDIFGKPMVQWVYENCQKATLVDKLVLATDDERILSVAESFSEEVIMTSEAHKSGTDRCAEVLNKLTEQDDNYDLVINIQGDEPFVNAQNIDKLIQLMMDSKESIGTLGKVFIQPEILDNPNRVKIRQSQNEIQFFRKLEEFEDFQLPGIKHIGMYAYKAEVLRKITALPISENEKALQLEQMRWLDNGYNIALAIIENEGPSVDTQEDLEEILSKGEAFWC